MLLFLIVGYFQMGFTLMLIILLPFLIYLFVENQSRQMSAEDISFVRRSLTAMDYNPLIHKLEKECVICTLEFEPTDKVA